MVFERASNHDLDPNFIEELRGEHVALDQLQEMPRSKLWPK